MAYELVRGIKWIATPNNRMQFFAVHGDFALPIHRAEVEKKATTVFEVGSFEGAVIDELLIRADAFHDAGEGGFDGEGDEDLAVPFIWRARGPPRDRGLPHEGV